jgi:hypothetical protein
MLFAGAAATFFAAIGAYYVILGTALDCGGTDVSRPSRSALCSSGYAMTFAYIGAGTLVALPLLGTFATIKSGKWFPLAAVSTVGGVGFFLFFFLVPLG